MINLDTVRAHVTAIGDLLDLPFAHPDAYEGLDDAVLREHVAVHLRAALEDDEVPTPPGAEKTTPLEGALAEFLNALRDLTDDEVEALAAAYAAPRDAAQVAAWCAAWDAARSAAPDAAWRAAWDAMWGAALNAARAAVRDAALALVVADLVGQHGLTREHLDVLAGPARVVPRLATIIDRALSTESAR